MDYISLSISLIALLISVSTFWLTRLKSGVIRMTRPTVIFFGPDGVGEAHKKVFIRTLLYSTSDKGKYIQNMFIRLQLGNSTQNFNVWVYDNNGLVRGSGLYVNKNGIACNHHFLMPRDGSVYDFLSGEYNLQIFVESVDKTPKKIFDQKLLLSDSQQKEMLAKKAGIYFDWEPNTQDYFSHVDEGPKKDKELTDLVKSFTQEK
jgi:hypothetical protein